jgi:thiol-disulfide isomerase/thioredoxin
MFKRSFWMVLLIVALVFTSGFVTQMALTKDLPSSYDPGLSIEQAFKTSKVPLLIEFYSDSCGTCKILTPVIHDLHRTRYKDRLTVVMLDASEPSTQDIARLFGVDSLPAVYVFDHHHMKKHEIKPEDLTSRARIQQAIDAALLQTGSSESKPQAAS